tara:strand:- start:72 stop:851 length:780 start_codon:yes stop_codon:yes gene_type:complete
MFRNNIPSGFHISKGTDSVFYILNDGNTFIKNLSKDLEESKIQAKNIVGKDVDVSIWTRIYQTKKSKPKLGFEPLQRYALPKGYAVNKFNKVFYSIKDFPLFHKSWHSKQVDITPNVDNDVLIFGYDWRKNKKDKEYNAIKNSQWLGKVKEEISFKGKIIVKKEINCFYGKTNLYKFDVDGNVVLTFTQLQLGEINQVVSIKAKVSKRDYGSNEYGERNSVYAKTNDYNSSLDNYYGGWFWRKITKINKPQLIKERANG